MSLDSHSHILESVPNFVPEPRPSRAQSVASRSWPMVWRHNYPCANDFCVLAMNSHIPRLGLTWSLYNVALGLDDVSGTQILFDSEILVLASTHVFLLLIGLPSHQNPAPWPTTKHLLLAYK